MPLHRVWEYRDIGRLFSAAEGEECDNRGAEVGLWVEVILRVSLEVILRKLLRHTPWHPVSAANRPDRPGSTPRSLWGCHKPAAERATDGVPSEVMECET